jgi:copper chaperone
MTRKELIAPAMSCGHCKMTIEGALKGLAGVSSASADPASKKVMIEFDEQTVTLDAIRKAIEDAGYRVEG